MVGLILNPGLPLNISVQPGACGVSAVASGLPTVGGFRLTYGYRGADRRGAPLSFPQHNIGSDEVGVAFEPPTTSYNHRYVKFDDICTYDPHIC
jgi:hypothetical protein